MTLQILAKAIFDRWWVAYIYFVVTAITGIHTIFTSSFASGAAAVGACTLCFIGPSGFIGSLRARHDSNYGVKELMGIAVVAMVLTTAGIGLMIWSGFSLIIFGVAIEGPYWTLMGVLIAIIVTKKEHVQ